MALAHRLALKPLWRCTTQVPLQPGAGARTYLRESRQPKKPVPLAKVLRRDGFDGDLKKLPRDAEMLRTPVLSLANMKSTEVECFAQRMNRYGAAVLVPDRSDMDEGASAYKTLDRLLGTCVSHDAMDEHGIVEINPAKPTSINTADPEKEHLPHTDDAYTEHPARFITLQCRQAAPSGGGQTVLVSGIELLATLSSEELRALMQPGKVTMGRRPASDGSWMKCSAIPMFWVNRDSGWLQLRWRCNDGCVQDIDREVKLAYERMDAVARNGVHHLVLNLAPREVLVVDNRAHAHGRRTYEPNEPRIMWRRNYFGDGELATTLSVGMVSVFSSMFDSCSSVFDDWHTLPKGLPSPA